MDNHPFNSQVKILIIEDDPLIRRMVIKSLTAAGYAVLEAASGIEGIATAQRVRPHLILLDLMMPGLDGYQVCTRLRQHPSTANLPIIMLTALDQTEAKVQGLRSGADDYITKPFEMEELIARVQVHLRRSVRDIGANPLTTLPGNQAIEQIVHERLTHHQPLAVLYIDLTNFKTYNDEYGWLKGDGVIRALAQQIMETLEEVGGKGDFVGHIGGDDFIVVSTPERAEAIAKGVIARFDAVIPSFYVAEDRARGYIQAIDRRGNPFQASIVSVAIGIITNERKDLTHPGQIAAQAAELKKYVKSLPGSQYAFDRRHK